MVILYEVHDNLYVNMTNKCPCACTFCLRQTRDEMNHSGSLWLEREPSVEEVKNEEKPTEIAKEEIKNDLNKEENKDDKNEKEVNIENKKEETIREENENGFRQYKI